MRRSNSVQAPSAVAMIRPHHFSVNNQTAKDNTFQNNNPIKQDTAEKAYKEITNVAEILGNYGVKVLLFDDQETYRPDAVFLNNWFSTHSGGHVAIFPMTAPNRRLERRQDIIEMLKHHYRVQEITDYSGLEIDNLFLEGTGAMVLDHIERVAYVVRSNRADPIVLERFCAKFQYEPMVFDATDSMGVPIYHTNVLMSIGTHFALVGFDLITDKQKRQQVKLRLQQSGREVIELSREQIENFAGNTLELNGSNGKVLAISTRALASLNIKQKLKLESYLTLVPLDIPTLELAGGSVRCLLAGIHLKSRL